MSADVTKVDTGLPSLTPFERFVGMGMDAMFLTLFVSVIMAPVESLPAYKLGLINKSMRIIKEPDTEEEIRALNYLTRVALEMKRVSGARARLLFVLYRKERRRPGFIRSISRLIAMRYGRYFGLMKPMVDGNIFR